MELAQKQFEHLPVQNGYKNVEAVKKAYESAGRALQKVKRRQAEESE